MMDLPTAIKWALTCLLLLAAWSDARRFLIPNLYPALIMLIFPVALLTSFPFEAPLWSHMMHFAVALVAGMALFRFGWFGGGDVKLYAAVTLWFGISSALFLFVVTTVSGGLVVLVRLAFYFLKLSVGSGGPKVRLLDRRIAYGIAIATGGIASIWTQYP